MAQIKHVSLFWCERLADVSPPVCYCIMNKTLQSQNQLQKGFPR